MTTYSKGAPFYNAISSDPHTVLVPRSLSNPHGTPLAFSSNPWAVGDAAEWEQNQAGRSSAVGVACENPLLDRKQPTSLSEYAPFASRSIDRVLSVIACGC